MPVQHLPAKVWRRGRNDDPPPRMTLRAGPLDLLFEQGELRSIRLGDREVISRIYVAVRDRNWDTAPPALSKILHEVGEASFRISFDVSCPAEGDRFHLERADHRRLIRDPHFLNGRRSALDIHAESHRFLHPASRQLRRCAVHAPAPRRFPGAVRVPPGHLAPSTLHGIVGHLSRDLTGDLGRSFL